MIKPQKLNKGDKVAILSLSRGLLGMPFSHVYLITTFLLFLMYMPLVGLDTL